MNSGRRRHGRLVAIEGIDGSGKSTVVPALARVLRRRGLSVAVRREPADAALGSLAQRAGAVDPWTGAIYFTLDRFAARPRLVRDLERHDLVLTDRSFYSTLAYQGSSLPPAAYRRLAELQRRATIVPDRVVLLEIPLREAARRRAGRARSRGPLEGSAVQRRVAGAYRRLARQGRWWVVDATRPSHEVVGELAGRLGPVPRSGRRRAGSRARRRR
ncbi:MAG TPA: dTMP kinase [Thermoplasmata archaeon]|nr:dTMP kinase [Thermoplasmata archaeon]